jgi:threonine dehydrogenase-like Zn-dependent dehydrogenase
LLGASTPLAQPRFAPRASGAGSFFIGEGGTVEFNPSPDMIHDQKTLYGSWVTSTWLMEELVERLVRWNLHPADIITHRFPLERAAEAYALMASGKCGKVGIEDRS